MFISAHMPSSNPAAAVPQIRLPTSYRTRPPVHHANAKTTTHTMTAAAVEPTGKARG